MGDKRRLRQQVVATYRQFRRCGLGTGSSGNVSVRTNKGMLITPSGARPQTLAAAQIVHLSLDGSLLADTACRASSEWQLHAQVYLARPDINAVVHCHSRYATVMACAHREIPALHYMIAATGHDNIPVAPYSTFGTAALARDAAIALGDGQACLMANHGQLAAGDSLEQAINTATEVEELAAIYWASLQIGGPVVLSAAQMQEVQLAFKGYGAAPPAASD
tara:strand:- start:317033 stop:317695 length:663 start_codon:yes stop_codon:yes gene_type:complete